MTKLILIRHSISKQQTDVKSSEWVLTHEGQILCEILAKQLYSYRIARIYTSEEPKAYFTGKIVANTLNIPCEKSANLEETRRESKVFFDNQDEFKAKVREAMKNSDELRFGDETFTDARKRFSEQIEAFIQQHPNETLAIATHGRVMSMYLGYILKRDPVEIWNSLTMPAYAVLSLPEKNLVTLVNHIQDET